MAALLEAARTLAGKREALKRDVILLAFTAEETGVLGSTHHAKNPTAAPIKDMVAMLNLDMVGRLRADRLAILGGDSAAEWPDLARPVCEAAGLECTTSGDGYGPSDQTPFYAAGIPVLHFFTGAHADYHKPSDTAANINAAGLARVAQVFAGVAAAVDARPGRLAYKNVPAPAPAGDLRSFNASLGSIPDYAGPPGQKGVLLAGVRAGSAAEKAGLRRGDILVRFGTHDVASIQDFMFALNASKPGQLVKLTVLREGKPLEVEATLQEGRRR